MYLTDTGRIFIRVQNLSQDLEVSVLLHRALLIPRGPLATNAFCKPMRLAIIHSQSFHLLLPLVFSPQLKCSGEHGPSPLVDLVQSLCLRSIAWIISHTQTLHGT